MPGRGKPQPAVGDFSYVEVVGCLTRGAENTWMLTKASHPIAASPSSSPDGAVTPLGTETLHLIDAMAYAPEQHAGQKMHVRGLLIKLPDEQRMSISAIEMVSPACRD